MANKWMQKAADSIKAKGTKGSFSRMAKKAGESTHAFAEEKQSAPGKTGKKARLALAFEKAKH